MEKTYSRTNIYLIDEGIWKWAKFRASTLEFTSVSEYLFALIESDKLKPELLVQNLIEDKVNVRKVGDQGGGPG